MTSPEAKAVMKALSGGGAANPEALFVGGCVRNTLMGRPVDDVDIATVWVPDEVAGKLSAAGIRAVPTGIEHGTITAIRNGKPFEITTLRRDVSTDGRRAVVAFTTDWAEDAQRRDFTLNTLLADETGNVYDPTGRGLPDLRAGRVVFVGNPAQRIAEDYLRILRFFRFHATCGKGSPDAEGIAACRAAADKISTLSRERITQEFFRILSVENPLRILEIMFDNNVMKDVSDKECDRNILSHLCLLQNKYKTPDALARLVVLCAFKESRINVLNEWFSFSREQAKTLGTFFAIAKNMARLNETGAKTLAYKNGTAIAIQSVLLFYARKNAEPDSFFDALKKWQPPALPVSGNDVMNAGIPSGPTVGKILSAVESWWIEGNFSANRDDCLKKMKELMEGKQK